MGNRYHTCHVSLSHTNKLFSAVHELMLFSLTTNVCKIGNKMTGNINKYDRN